MSRSRQQADESSFEPDQDLSEYSNSEEDEEGLCYVHKWLEWEFYEDSFDWQRRRLVQAKLNEW